jgi:lycopene cyclase domain-containing protein
LEFTYLLVNLLSVGVPLACSFESKVHFVGRWKALFPAMIVVAAAFIVWDSLFTRLGVWGFSHIYTVGPRVAGLPVEELLFFFAIPYCCVFTYEVLNRFVTWQPSDALTRTVFWIMAVALAVVAIMNTARLYSFWTAILTALFIVIHLLWLKAAWLPHFLRAYAVILIPFLIVNGILTGTCLSEPVVWYDNAHNLGLRILTIPVEDVFYGMLLIGLNISVYEWLKGR